MTEKIKILIADDHSIVRKGLKQIVSEQTDMIVAGEASDTSELFSLLEKDNWSVVVLDINMPGRSGLEALRDLKSAFPDLPVLILSIYSEDIYGIRAVKAGADGYLKKVSAPDELVTAIRRIVEGGKYISQQLSEKLASNLKSDTVIYPHEKLSDREYQILCLIALGKSAEQISQILSISVNTFYSYRNRILEKMGLKTNVELARYAIRNKLVEPE